MTVNYCGDTYTVTETKGDQFVITNSSRVYLVPACMCRIIPDAPTAPTAEEPVKKPARKSKKNGS